MMTIYQFFHLSKFGAQESHKEIGKYDERYQSPSFASWPSHLPCRGVKLVVVPLEVIINFKLPPSELRYTAAWR